MLTGVLGATHSYQWESSLGPKCPEGGLLGLRTDWPVKHLTNTHTLDTHYVHSLRLAGVEQDLWSCHCHQEGRVREGRGTGDRWTETCKTASVIKVSK